MRRAATFAKVTSKGEGDRAHRLYRLELEWLVDGRARLSNTRWEDMCIYIYIHQEARVCGRKRDGAVSRIAARVKRLHVNEESSLFDCC